MSEPRAFRLGTIAIAALTLAFALVATVPSTVRPEVASAQTFCNGAYYPYGTTCTVNTGVSCSGVFYANTSTCPNTGTYCYGAYYPTGTACGTNAAFCSGYYPPIGNVCPTTSTYCNGVYYPSGTICSTVNGNVCGLQGGRGNGPSDSPQAVAVTTCPVTSGVYCNGISYASLAVCPSLGTSCYYGSGYSAQPCYGTYVVCSNGQQVLAGQQCPASISVSSAYPAPIVTSSGYSGNSGYVSPPSGFSVSYFAGWNIVAGPTGTILTGTVGPLYTFRAGDTTYETLPSGVSLPSGVGYWAYFTGSTTTGIGTAGAGSVTIPLPAGQFVMIGNPGNTTATLTGADAVLVYNSLTSSYNQTTSLGPGQGAWAISSNGGQVTITNAPY